MKYNVYNTKKEASKAAYELIKKSLGKEVTLGLATGSTPTDLYEEMIADHKAGETTYKKITTYNLDEYVGISYDHPESYHKFMDDRLFNHIDINKENVHIPDASAKDLEAAVKNYQKMLDEATIDIQVLGVGGNGHIGFNEPGTSFDSKVHVVDLAKETVEANSRFFNGDISQVPKQAVSMGISDIMKAKLIVLLAFGESKKEAIRSLFENDDITEDIPCTILKKHPNVHVFVDKEADYK